MTKYFILRGKEQDDIRALLQRDLDTQKQVKRLCKEFGATSAMVGHGFATRFLLGFVFKADPDPTLWKKHRDRTFWLPRLSSKAGKDLKRRLDAVKLPGGWDVAKIIKMDCFKGLVCRSPGAEQFGKKIVVKVPDDVNLKIACSRISDLTYEKLEADKRRGCFK